MLNLLIIDIYGPQIRYALVPKCDTLHFSYTDLQPPYLALRMHSVHHVLKVVVLLCK